MHNGPVREAIRAVGMSARASRGSADKRTGWDLTATETLKHRHRRRRSAAGKGRIQCEGDQREDSRVEGRGVAVSKAVHHDLRR